VQQDTKIVNRGSPPQIFKRCREMASGRRERQGSQPHLSLFNKHAIAWRV